MECYPTEKIVCTKDYLIAEGTDPCCLIAHMDTVFHEIASEIYLDQDKNVMWSPQGLGADDRAGIFAILELLEQGLRPSVIFTSGEEIGGKGAKTLIRRFPKCPFKDIKYLIQLDRAGASDCVFYDCENIGFIDYVRSFGFEEAWGTFSDISVIAPAWGIAATNLSIGYVDEHSIGERLFLNDMINTIQKVSQMISELNESPTWNYVPRKEKRQICVGCGASIPSWGSVKIQINNQTMFICDHCYVEIVEREY